MLDIYIVFNNFKWFGAYDSENFILNSLKNLYLNIIINFLVFFLFNIRIKETYSIYIKYYIAIILVKILE